MGCQQHGSVYRRAVAASRKRTERRVRERAARKLVHDRERLAALLPGGSAARPIDIPSPAVVETRVASMRCPQCEGSYVLDEHDAEPGGIRVASVTCRVCHVGRRIWFRLGSSAPS